MTEHTTQFAKEPRLRFLQQVIIMKNPQEPGSAFYDGLTGTVIGVLEDGPSGQEFHKYCVRFPEGLECYIQDRFLISVDRP